MKHQGRNRSAYERDDLTTLHTTRCSEGVAKDFVVGVVVFRVLVLLVSVMLLALTLAQLTSHSGIRWASVRCWRCRSSVGHHSVVCKPSLKLRLVSDGAFFNAASAFAPSSPT